MAKLADIEAQLVSHAQAEKRRWQDIAQLLLMVEREKLWEAQASSFTAWIQGVARRADLQESVFWRCLKAGRIYRELTGREELDEPLAVSAESLELADKIRRHAPKAITTSVLERTLEGELSRAELRDIWSTYKPAAGGATARGRLPQEASAREEAIAARQATWESQKRNPENRSAVRRAEMIASFRDGRWLGPVDQARAETHTARLGGRLAAMLTVRRESTKPELLELHGLWTCVSEPELADYDFTTPAATDFMWLAVTSDLIPRAQKEAPQLLGLLELSPNRTLQVLRAAQRRSITAQARLTMLSELLQRAYCWP